jgi:hypothetical protein
MNRSVAGQLRECGPRANLFTKPILDAQEPCRRAGSRDRPRLAAEPREHLEHESLGGEGRTVVIRPHLVVEAQREHRDLTLVDRGRRLQFQLELARLLEPPAVELDAEEPPSGGADLVFGPEPRGMEADGSGTIAEEPPADGLGVGAVQEQGEVRELVLVRGKLSLAAVADVGEVEPRDPRFPGHGPVELTGAQGAVRAQDRFRSFNRVFRPLG